MPPKKKVYLIPGLGADERVFQNINLTSYEPIIIQWIRPFKNEPIQDYAKRLTTQITTPYPVLIGLSFGGMIAIEIAKQIPTEKVILISSAKTKDELPPYFRWIGITGLHRLVPASYLKTPNPFGNYLFGVKTPSEKTLLAVILRDTDIVFLKWAMDQIIHWENNTTIPGLVHIHGTNDKLLPARFIIPNFWVKGGGHLMVLNAGEQINKLIKGIIENQ